MARLGYFLSCTASDDSFITREFPSSLLGASHPLSLSVVFPLRELLPVRESHSFPVLFITYHTYIHAYIHSCIVGTYSCSQSLISCHHVYTYASMCACKYNAIQRSTPAQMYTRNYLYHARQEMMFATCQRFSAPASWLLNFFLRISAQICYLFLHKFCVHMHITYVRMKIVCVCVCMYI
jgi:hypothetical protein